MNKIKINIVGVHFFKGSIKEPGHAFGIPGVGFGHQKNCIAIFRIFFKIFSNASFAAALIAVRCIPVGYTPTHGLFHHYLVGGDVKHSAQ